MERVNQQRQRGAVELIETLLVLVIVALIIVLGMRYYQSRQKDAAAKATYEAEQFLKNALYDYYLLTCDQQPNSFEESQPFNSLQANKLLTLSNLNLLNTRFVNNQSAWWIGWKTDASRRLTFYVQIKFNSLSDLERAAPYRGLMGTPSVDLSAFTLTWQYPIEQMVSRDKGAEFSLMQSGLKQLKQELNQTSQCPVPIEAKATASATSAPWTFFIENVGQCELPRSSTSCTLLLTDNAFEKVASKQWKIDFSGPVSCEATFFNVIPGNGKRRIEATVLEVQGRKRCTFNVINY